MIIHNNPVTFDGIELSLSLYFREDLDSLHTRRFLPAIVVKLVLKTPSLLSIQFIL